MDKSEVMAMMNELFEKIIQHCPADESSTRLFHGRGKTIPDFEFLVVDYYAPTLLITLYAEAPKNFVEEFIAKIPELPMAIENILIQKRYIHKSPLEVVKGCVPEKAFAQEDGCKYQLKFGTNQNIGFFLDMALGRKKLSLLARSKKVLNLFSYTCSLSVAALKGGASEVVNIDMSKGALSVGEMNHRLNDLALSSVRFLPYDIMSSWNNIYKRGPYDIVVIDPPTNQGDSFKVERDYYKIIKRLKEMTSERALVFACVNSPYIESDFLIHLFKEHAQEFLLQEKMYSAFQDMEVNPEEGLKIVIFQRTS